MSAITEQQLKAEPSQHPMNVMLEVSAQCNLKCPMCPRQHKERQNRQDGLMAYRGRTDPLDPSDTFHRVIDQIHPERIGMFYSGEPLLNRWFTAMCREAKFIHGLPNMRVNTNGTLLAKDDAITEILTCGLDEIIFSLECNERVQRMLRVGADYHVVKANIMRVMDFKSHSGDIPTPRLLIQHLTGDGISPKEIEASIAEWAKLGIKVKTASISKLAGQVPDMGDTRKKLPRCREVWTNAIISWKGDVTPCCIDHGFALSFGNLLQTPMSELWTGRKITALRKGHTIYNATGDIHRLPALCKRCLGVQHGKA